MQPNLVWFRVWFCVRVWFRVSESQRHNLTEKLSEYPQPQIITCRVLAQSLEPGAHDQALDNNPDQIGNYLEMLVLRRVAFGPFSFLLQILTISVGSLETSRNFRGQVQKQLWILDDEKSKHYCKAGTT